MMIMVTLEFDFVRRTLSESVEHLELTMNVKVLEHLLNLLDKLVLFLTGDLIFHTIIMVMFPLTCKLNYKYPKEFIQLTVSLLTPVLSQ